MEDVLGRRVFWVLSELSCRVGGSPQGVSALGIAALPVPALERSDGECSLPETLKERARLVISWRAGREAELKPDACSRSSQVD